MIACGKEPGTVQAAGKELYIHLGAMGSKAKKEDEHDDVDDDAD